eukprot:209492-Pyramimonas_sp.AAC.1
MESIWRSFVHSVETDASDVSRGHTGDVYWVACPPGPAMATPPMPPSLRRELGWNNFAVKRMARSPRRSNTPGRSATRMARRSGKGNMLKHQRLAVVATYISA